MKTDNELIAEFMGLAKSKDIWDQGQHAYTMKFPSVFNKMVVPSEMLFDCSWDWLMPVVEKIQSMGYDYTVKGIGKEETIVTIYCDTYTSKRKKVSMIAIDAYYQSVVEFIKWYNQQSR